MYRDALILIGLLIAFTASFVWAAWPTPKPSPLYAETAVDGRSSASHLGGLEQ